MTVRVFGPVAAVGVSGEPGGAGQVGWSRRTRLVWRVGDGTSGSGPEKIEEVRARAERSVAQRRCCWARLVTSSSRPWPRGSHQVVYSATATPGKISRRSRDSPPSRSGASGAGRFVGPDPDVTGPGLRDLQGETLVGDVPLGGDLWQHGVEVGEGRAAGRPELGGGEIGLGGGAAAVPESERGGLAGEARDHSLAVRREQAHQAGGGHDDQHADHDPVGDSLPQGGLLDGAASAPHLGPPCSYDRPLPRGDSPPVSHRVGSRPESKESREPSASGVRTGTAPTAL